METKENTTLIDNDTDTELMSTMPKEGQVREFINLSEIAFY